MSDESTAESAAAVQTLEASPTQAAPVQDAGIATAQAPEANAATPNATPVPGSSSATNTRSAEDLLKAAVAPITAGTAPIPPPPVVAPALPPDVQARLDQVQHLQKYTGNLSNELGNLRKQVSAYEGLPPADQLRQMLAQQKQAADSAKLTPFSARHPEHRQTMSRVDLFKAFEAARNADPERAQDAAWINRLGQSMGVSVKDRELYQDYEAHKANTQYQLATDPEGFVENIVTSRVEAMLAQREQYQGVRNDTERFLTQNGPLVEKHRDVMLQVLDPNISRRDIGIELIKAREALAALQAAATQNVRTVETAKAQVEATQTKATVRRDAAPSTPVDPQKIAKSIDYTRPIQSNQAMQLFDALASNKST